MTAVLFDFGGVLAEEGFKAGIRMIAEKNGLEAQGLKKVAFDMVYQLGFVTGKIRDDVFWQAFREKTGVRGEDAVLKTEILSRFILRPWMMDIVQMLKRQEITVAILSDQTHWLDELNQRDDFFRRFDAVFNSYHTGITKKDPEFFDQVLNRLHKKPEEVLFIDDHSPHLERAAAKGLHTILYANRMRFLSDLKIFFPDFPIDNHPHHS